MGCPAATSGHAAPAPTPASSRSTISRRVSRPLFAAPPWITGNFSEHKPRFELKYRNLAPEIVRKTRPIQMKFGVCNEYTYDWFVNDLEEPYTTPSDKPFNWMGRLRITGGRTNVWGRVSLRFSEWDFRAASVDGYGENWP